MNIKPTVPEEAFLHKNKFYLFISYYKPNLRLFLIDMLCALFISLIDLSFPMLTRHILQTYLPNENYSVFFWIVVFIFIAYILRTAMQYVVSYWGHLMGANIEMQMRNDLFLHLQKLPFSFFDNQRTGHLMTRILSDLFDITELTHHGPEDLFISFITLIGSCIALFFINRKLALCLIVFLPILLCFALILRKRMARASRHLKESTSSINADIESCLSGIRVAKAFANESYEADKFSRGNRMYKNARGEFYRSMATFFSGMEFFISLLSVSVIAFGGYLIMKKEMTAVDLLAFTLYIAAFVTPIRKLTNFTEMYQSGMAGFDRFVTLMREIPSIINKENPVELQSITGNIEFSHVSFSYAGNKEDGRLKDEVLHDVSFTISGGNTVAVVGPSGGGKTTLCHLIPRFYEPQSGHISIDGMDIRDIEISSLRKNIGIVQQDVFLFASTIYDNIRYGRLDATDDEIQEAAKKAELHDFIESLPEKYNTFVGERGMLLSGGQKQRIAIARVFLKNPPILILDEATSALDTQTERRIQIALDRLSIGRTCVVIAHRLSTITHADTILYLDESGIRERGSHQNLLAEDGLYAKLYHAQYNVNSSSGK